MDNPNSEDDSAPFISASRTNVKLYKNENELLHGSDTKAYEAVYDTLAELIANGENVTIQTKNGSYVYGKIENIASCTQALEVIATDLSVVERMVVCRGE